MQFIRSFLFTTYLFLSAVVTAIGVIVMAFFPHRWRFAWVTLWTKSVMWVLKILCGLDYEVEGQENVPGENAIVMLKHSSAWETLAEFLFIPPTHCWVAKRELLWLPFIGWALVLMKCIAINRKAGRSAVDQVVTQGCERLEEGIWVMIFPEGTRVAPGTTKRYGMSGALLAKKSGRCIVPVAHNAGDFWPRRGWKKTPGKIRVIIGPPIHAGDRHPREITAEVQTWIENTVATISPHYDMG